VAECEIHIYFDPTTKPQLLGAEELLYGAAPQRTREAATSSPEPCWLDATSAAR
jgi:hypothetical protein